MKKTFLIISLLVLSTLVYGKKINKAIYIIIDGVPSDVIEKVSPPTIDSIAKMGGYARSYTGGEIGGPTETPTISAVGYNNILTATWANKHNVWDNEIANPNYNYPSIFWVTKHCKENAKIGVFSGWKENVTKLVGDDAVGTGMLHVDYSFGDSDQNTEKYPLNDPMRIFNLDQDVTNLACRYIVKNGPDVTWIYLWFMDEVGHRHGTGDEFEKYLMMVDKQVSQIWSAVKTREKNTGEKWLTIVTTDHGRTLTEEGKSHGGQSDRERSTWIAMDKTGNEYFTSGDTLSNTDIVPTICNFIGMRVPIKIAEEWEGVPLIGKIDFSGFKAIREGDKIKFYWKGYTKGDVTIRMCTTDNIKNGEIDGKDKWYNIGKRPAMEGYYEWDCNNFRSDFYKFQIVGQSTVEGTWVSNH